MSQPAVRVIALGAGVQSSTVYCRAALGHFGAAPDFAVFADTHAEPPWVYSHLEYLQGEFGHVIPIRRASQGSLEQAVLDSRGGVKRWASVPFFTTADTARGRGRLRRFCTREYKIEVIKREIRRAVGRRRVRAEEWVGISLDEAHRAKPSRYPWISTRWPLLEVRMTRADCIAWLQRAGLAVPRKSACYFCPFHDDATWGAMKRDAPDVFERAVYFDLALREGPGPLRGVREQCYLHSSLRPLGEVDFDADADGDQLEFSFGEECEGMCGV